MSATASVACRACGELTPAGKKFCIHCGTPVQEACPSCGEQVVARARFCAECGTALTNATADAPASVSERRLVSVLFADLVGFTTLSEHRDPEAVRELLSHYFDRCRTLIERYGGTVEKFIGDAVMAVWGTPVAREDDAERAVRTGLALTRAVSELSEELRVRVGILTGSAAVELGAEGEGMVLGDTVNTASRLQSIAEPGTVLVDDVTRRASEAAIAYLLEWSADFPIFILALGRTELLASRPAWTPTITLGPLGDEPMAELLRGLVPGLPEELASQIRSRAEGVPLYAVETVRMLLDRALVAEEGSRYVITGDVSDLEVPETLQALAAARLDNLDHAERSLLQDAAVIGQSFTPATLTAVVARPAADVQRLLDALVTKQVLAYVDDPRSGERGQYVFLQALLRQVALGTLPRRDRKARHLAVARQLRETSGEETGELAEVLASHYLEAVDADPDAADAPAIRASACQTLADAGRRAQSLALGPEARRHFERAAELAEEPAARGRLLREAGLAAQLSGELDEALSRLTDAARLLKEAGMDRESAVIDGGAGYVLQVLGRNEEAVELLRYAYTAVDDGSDDEALADLAARRAAVEFQQGNKDESLRLADIALRIADGLRLWTIVVRALISKGNGLAETGRPSESTALLTHAVQLALEHDLPVEAASAHFNLAENVMSEARFAEAGQLLDRGIALARQRGDRQGERRLLAQSALALIALGRWDEALDRIAVVREGADDIWAQQAFVFLPYVLSARGEEAAMRPLLEPLAAWHGWPAAEVQAQLACALILRETGRAQEAVPLAQAAVEADLPNSLSHLPFEFAEAVECAFAADEPTVVHALLERADALKPAQMLPLLEAEVARARARLAADRGQVDDAERWLERALALGTAVAA